MIQHDDYGSINTSFIATSAPPTLRRHVVTGHRASDARQLQATRVEPRTRLSTDLPPVFADRVQLQQLIFDVIVNAVEAMNAAGNEARE